MAIRHKNPYGYTETVDRPVPDCACKGCSSARRRERGGRRGGVARGVASAAMGIAQATSVGGAADLQPGQGGTFDQNWADSSLNRQRDDRTTDLEDGTRDKGVRDRGSSHRE